MILNSRDHHFLLKNITENLHTRIFTVLINNLKVKVTKFRRFTIESYYVSEIKKLYSNWQS